MTICQRCGEETTATIMSMHSQAMICMDCKDEEKKQPGYKAAEAKDLREHAGRLREKGEVGLAEVAEGLALSIETGKGLRHDQR